MSDTVYKNLKKFKNSQRLFEGSDGRYYLGDESADGRGTFGFPNETEDGPLAIITDEPIIGMWTKLNDNTFMVPVDVIRTGGKGVVGVTIDAALYLAARLNLNIKTEGGEYRIVNPPWKGVA